MPTIFLFSTEKLLLKTNRTQKYKKPYYQYTHFIKIKIVNNVFIKAG